MTNPYSNLEENKFWKPAVATKQNALLSQIHTPKWTIKSTDKIATAGSCFAQHITKKLRDLKFNVVDKELPPLGLPDDLHKQFGFSMYSARYGNIYTARQLYQLAQECFDGLVIDDIAWEKNGQWFDSQRPGVEPEGLSSREEVQLHRSIHIKNVSSLLQEMDIFIFTLGLTESWRNIEEGGIFPIAPGVIAGDFCDKYEFVNFTFNEVRRDLINFFRLVRANRPNKRPFKILLTVSPVPLTATASGKHVLVATNYSKGLLRTVAHQLSEEFSFIDYFPSFDIVTNPAACSKNFESNLRSVKQETVDSVMIYLLNLTVLKMVRLLSTLVCQKVKSSLI